ncbi:MAG: Ldh family oxidoreductase [Sulfolobales archaeon]|nr:Ldh family oxidoreductase [Sulfolobales archaeon]MDW8083391.1 Ldh family oxidoreductase [Sulfolobales archaeon]
MSELYLYERELVIPPEEYVRVHHTLAREFVYEIFAAAGLRDDDAHIVADVLVTADLMGISSHGIQRVRRYVDGLLRCCVNPRPDIRVVRDCGATALIDADNGLGHIAGVKAMEIAVEKAERYGVSLVLVKNSHHYGIAGYYSLKAVEKELIGISTTNSEKLVAYVNTVTKSLGTNPIAVGIPRKTPPPILFDSATAVIPVGKIEIYSKLGKTVPEGWVIDSEGRMLSGEASKVLSEIRSGKASILPLGGLGEEFGGHKGSGLAFIVDIISGVLSGAAWGLHVRYTVDTAPANVGHAFAAIDIDAFMSKEEFYQRIESYISEIKSLKKHPSADRIWIPGEKAWYTMMTRLKVGIPVHVKLCDELNSIAGNMGLGRRLC